MHSPSGPPIPPSPNDERSPGPTELPEGLQKRLEILIAVGRVLKAMRARIGDNNR